VIELSNSVFRKTKLCASTNNAFQFHPQNEERERHKAKKNHHLRQEIKTAAFCKRVSYDLKSGREEKLLFVFEK
jgi:hypothetical protein